METWLSQLHARVVSIKKNAACRYERSEGGVRTGRALVQRHVALSSDVANKEGQGLLVSTLAAVAVAALLHEVFRVLDPLLSGYQG